MPEPTLVFRMVTAAWFPHGLSCIRCDRSIREGQPYATRLTGMFTDGIPVSDITCVYC
jgi:hypothetical protein